MAAKSVSSAEKDLLKDALAQFKMAEDAETTNRQAALDDIRFARLGEQWDSKIAQQRRAEGRPMLTINRLPSFARQVINDARQNKPMITVRPSSSGAHQLTAKAFDGLIRHIQNVSTASIAFDTAIESAVYGGFGYWRVDVDYAHNDTFDLDILLLQVPNPFSVYGDPRQMDFDSRNWMFGFVIDDMPRDEFKQKYRGAEASNWTGGANTTPQWLEEDSVRVAEWWSRSESKVEVVGLSDGTVIKADILAKNPILLQQPGIQVIGTRTVPSYSVKHRCMTATDILSDEEWAGSYIPLVPCYGDVVNIEGERHLRSLIRDARDPQQMFNYWRTTATELVALAPRTPWVGPRGSFNTDAEKWATANTKSHPYIEFDPQPGQPPPQRQMLDGGVAAGALQEAMNASDDMKSVMGLHDASLGARSNETSGRAIFLRQKEGDTSTFHFIDNRDRSIEHTGRILVDLIPNVYTGQRVITVLSEDMKEAQIALGRPTPALNGHIFDFTAGKYAVVMKSGPSFTTKREETAQQMIEFSKVTGTGQLIADLVAKQLDWNGADEIAQRLQNALPPHVLGKAPPIEQQQMQHQLQIMGQQLQVLTQENAALKLELKLNVDELEVKKGEVEVSRAEVGVKQQELQVRELEARTEGVVAISEAQQAGVNPEVIQRAYTPLQATKLSSILNELARPKKRKGKAVKQADGTWMLEVMEDNTPAAPAQSVG